MNDLRLPISALYLIERFQKNQISLSRLYRKRCEAIERKQFEDYINIGLALAYITSVEKYQQKTANTID